MRVVNSQGACNVGFIFWKAKLAPRPEHATPRHELCGAALAVELAELIQTDMDTQLNAINFCTDSKAVLGYIHNQTGGTKCTSIAGQNESKWTLPQQWNGIIS